MRRTGARIVRSMPAVFRVIGIIGTVAMLWVGGHLVIINLADTFWHGLCDVLNAVMKAIESAGPVVVWVSDTALSAVFGLILGLIVVAIISGISRLLRSESERSVRAVPGPYNLP
ncbi:putative DNA repair protein MutK [Cryobacterium sp. CAN_C3]|nr:putative DNA repair protein MutK [Cryobacterium sp. CAN_C3]